MKRGLLIGLISAVFLAGFVLLAGNASAACVGGDTQLILRLSSNTNAHGEFWNGAGGYTTDICFDSIFGTTYSGASPHDCAAGNSNIVLRLSSSTNAHAEGLAGTTPGYTPACYGDLECEFSTTGACLTAGKVPIVRLSRGLNAHLEISSGTYANVVCCSSPSAPLPPHCTNTLQDADETGVDCGGLDCPACAVPSHCTNTIQDADETGVDCGGLDCSACPTGPEAYWATVVGTRYGNGAEANVWDTIKLVAKGVSSGATVNFDVKDEDCLTGSPPCSGDDEIATFSANAGADGHAEYNWTIDQSAFDLGGEAENIELYFIATATGYSQQSPILNVAGDVEPTFGVCGDYTTETTCEEDINNYATNTEDPRYQLLNCSSSSIDCYCAWKGGTSPTCILNSTGTGPSNPITPTVECLWECSYPDYTSGTCTDGLMDIRANAIFGLINGASSCAPGFGADDVGCVDQTTSVMCGAPELSMPLFGIAQFVISVIAITGVYILIELKRRE